MRERKMNCHLAKANPEPQEMIVTVKRGAEERCFFHIFFVKKKLDLSPRSMSMQYRRALSVGELPQNL
jgi:hypothetical protein